jgi:hypothetical protein
MIIFKSGCHLFVGDAVPYAIRGDDYCFIVLCDARENLDLWVTSNSDGFCHEISQGASHSKPRELLVLEPDSFRSVMLASKV